MRMHILFVPALGPPVHVYDVGERPPTCRRTKGEGPSYLEDYQEDGEVVICELEEEHHEPRERPSDGFAGRTA